MSDTKNARINMEELTPCHRCKRPLFREHLPILGMVRTLSATQESIKWLTQSIGVAQVMGHPPMIAKALYNPGIDFEYREDGDGPGQQQHQDAVLCFRCLAALAAVVAK